MKIVNISQTNQRDEWKAYRRGKITGTSVGKIFGKSRKADEWFTDKPLQGFWEKVAERIALPADETEPAMERGTRLEDEAVVAACEKLQLDNYQIDAKLWQSDDNPQWLCSPDAYENVERPTWAMECKCLSSARHLKQVYENRPDDEFMPQIVNYFLVNPDLKVLYFVLYDPRVCYNNIALKIFKLTRETLSDKIDQLRLVRERAENEITRTVSELAHMKAGNYEFNGMDESQEEKNTATNHPNKD